MELWIRSQQKKLLLQVQEVRADIYVGKKLHNNNTNEDIITFDGNDKFYVIRANSEIVGEYESEERCLEIIEQIYGYLYTTTATNRSGEFFAKDFSCNACSQSCIVYQMPEK